MAKKKTDEKPKVAKELDGLELNIDSFGEIQKSLPIDKINEFLNKKVDDKKLRDRDDLDEIKGTDEEE
ncbi:MULTISPECIES: hypothetical protein [Roseivirga]|jgi:hypothetical protein|uniref:Uncharacterized protein n=1 Tax=Roseivirga spongicola TaxID=333140 RepID=A0A150XFE2_9BACT|nr:MULTISPECIES: hypothetical protein [Roseivirga]PWL30134.1 MAG: hypothetical protein DCO95_09900 [Roseivirga sp. XM-24bin3]KYG77421.1 hypothetical protein AWW68_01225 [Roseivirga spongicola]MBO6496277.1 hypothetical protein [Roseivirga sp.]MBO6661788.1 hypothetical protein [Roseivirga sp.]MBO6759901.1 hypothetical protein [Roseivirga sp.]